MYETSSLVEKLQGGHTKSAPSETSFVTLPHEIVDRVGLFSNRGVRLELAILAGFCFHHFENAASNQRITYTNGRKIVSPEGQFVVSMLTVAEDLFCRWFEGTPSLDNDDFRRFYDRVKRATRRLKSAELLVEHQKEGYSGILGTHWSIPWMTKKAMAFMEPIGLSDGWISSQVAEEDPLSVNVVDLIGKHLIQELSSDYTNSEFCASVYQRGRYHDTMNAVNTVARVGASSDRHISVGAFKTDTPHDDSPVAIPWVVIDVDSNDINDSFNKAHRITWLLEEEFSLTNYFVAYTGGRGFHIHIPSIAFGNPVFRNWRSAKQCLNRWADEWIDEYIDRNLFDPRHLVRMVGSLNLATGLYKTKLSREQWEDASLNDILRYSVNHNPEILPNPHLTGKICPDLAYSLADVSERGFWVPEMNDVEDLGSSGVIKAALEGCEEGEQWHPKHTGRSKLIFVAACHLIKNEPTDGAAYHELLKVNEKNTPPLPKKELDQCYRSAIRTVNGRTRNR